MRAKDTAGSTGAYSNVATVNTAAPTLTAPGSLTATSVSASQINLAWTAATETGGTISAYLIERCQGVAAVPSRRSRRTGARALTMPRSAARRATPTACVPRMPPATPDRTRGCDRDHGVGWAQPAITFVQALRDPADAAAVVTVAFAPPRRRVTSTW